MRLGFLVIKDLVFLWMLVMMGCGSLREWLINNDFYKIIILIVRVCKFMVYFIVEYYSYCESVKFSVIF